MYTLGYRFRPWEEAKSIADGAVDPALHRARRRATTASTGHIRYRHRVVRAEWSSADARWTVEAERTDTGEAVRLTCGFLFSCTGYYRYDEGYTPEFPGVERFGGPVVHPQHWPEDLDYTGKRVVVIGSGATAVTLVPALAERAEHVTMLQRSPTYVVSLPARDPVADLAPPRPARPCRLLARARKNVAVTTLFFQFSRRAPRLARNAHPPGRRGAAPARRRRRRPLQAAVRPLGPAPLPRPRRRPLPRRCAVGARRSSPTRSRPSPSAACASRRARSSRRTSSSPPPA